LAKVYIVVRLNVQRFGFRVETSELSGIDSRSERLEQHAIDARIDLLTKFITGSQT